MNNNLNILPISKWDFFNNTNRPVIIAGPCSVETKEQVMATAKDLNDIGINIFRAGIWKPRTHPGSFEGIGTKGLKWLSEIKNKFGMKIMTEVATPNHLEQAIKARIDAIWIGARTSANPFAVQDLADALNGIDIPVFVKNPINPDLELWIGSIERIHNAGIRRIAAIHRGFSVSAKNKYRNPPFWQIPIELKRRVKGLSIIGDPSHIGGQSYYIQEISQEFMDMGFEGLIVESHINPSEAWSDASQQISPNILSNIINSLIIRDKNTKNIFFKDKISNIRGNIDNIDENIIKLISERFKLVDDIAVYKKENNITIFQAERWDDIIKRIADLADMNDIDREYIIRIFNIIHQASIDRQNSIINRTKY